MIVDMNGTHHQHYQSFYCNRLPTDASVYACANGGVWNVNERRCICDPYVPYFIGPSCFVHVCLNGGTLMANAIEQYCQCPNGVTGRFCESGQ